MATGSIGSHTTSNVTVLGVDVTLGKVDDGSINETVTQNILGVDPVLGSPDPSLPRGSISDRVLPVTPIGYDVNGMPTFGSGKVNKITTWASDYAIGASGSLRYNTPLGPTKKLYSGLT